MMSVCKVPYENLVERNVGILSSKAQLKIKNMHIGVIGVGGVGGLTAVLLAKTGFGEITVVDKDEFEISNMNRQILATSNTINSIKVNAAKEVLEGHNPYVKVHNEYLNISNEEIAEKVIKNLDLCVVAVDNFETRILILRVCKRLGIPVVLAAAFGWKVFVTTITKDCVDYEQLIHAPSLGKCITEEVIKELDDYQRKFMYFSGAYEDFYNNQIIQKGTVTKTIAPVVNLASCAAVAEVVKYAAEVGKLFKCPDYFTMDMLTLEKWSVEETGVKTLLSFERKEG